MQRRSSTSWSQILRYPDVVRSGSISPWLSRNRIFEIVTSGNSSSRSPSTSPIERWGMVRSTPITSDIGALEEHQAELADLQLVAVTEWLRLVDAILVHVGAVERPGVADHVATLRALDLRVAPRHGDVVQADLAVGMPPETSDQVDELEPVTRLCSGAHDQDPHLGGQLPDRDRDVVVGARRFLQRID